MKTYKDLLNEVRKTTPLFSPMTDWQFKKIGRIKKAKHNGSDIEYATSSNGKVIAVKYNDDIISYADDWEESNYNLDSFLKADTYKVKADKKVSKQKNKEKVANSNKNKTGSIGSGFTKFDSKSDWERNLKKLKITDLEEEKGIVNAFDDEGNLRAAWYSKSNYGTYTSKKQFIDINDYREADPSIK